MVLFRQFVILFLIHIYTWVQFYLQEKLFLQKSTLNSPNCKEPYETSYAHKHGYLVKSYRNIKTLFEYSHMQGRTI